MLPLRNATPSSPSNISQPAQKFTVESGCPRPASQPTVIPSCCKGPQWRTNICPLSSLVSHVMLEKKSNCKVAPKGRNASLPYWSENIWVTWNIKQVTYHKYTISKMQLYKNRNPGKDNPQALYHLQATLFLFCQLFTFRAASPNLMYNMPLALHFVFIQNSYCSSKWNH